MSSGEFASAAAEVEPTILSGVAEIQGARGIEKKLGDKGNKSVTFSSLLKDVRRLAEGRNVASLKRAFRSLRLWAADSDTGVDYIERHAARILNSFIYLNDTDESDVVDKRVYGDSYVVTGLKAVKEMSPSLSILVGAVNPVAGLAVSATAIAINSHEIPGEIMDIFNESDDAKRKEKYEGLLEKLGENVEGHAAPLISPFGLSTLVTAAFVKTIESGVKDLNTEKERQAFVDYMVKEYDDFVQLDFGGQVNYLKEAAIDGIESNAAVLSLAIDRNIPFIGNSALDTIRTEARQRFGGWVLKSTADILKEPTETLDFVKDHALGAVEKGRFFIFGGASEVIRSDKQIASANQPIPPLHSLSITF
jgi:hypothetical protein